MKMKIKTVFSAAIAAAVFGSLAATAATENAATPLPTVTPAAPAAVNAATNTMPQDLVTKLFGDPVIAKGRGAEVKRSQLDAEILRIKTTEAAQGRVVSPEDVSRLEPRVLNSLIARQLVLAKATAEDKAKGKEEFDKVVQQLKTNGKLTDAQFDQQLDQQLKLLNITKGEWEAEGTGQTTMLAVLKRELNVAATDAEAREFYNSNSADFQVPERVHVRHILLLTVQQSVDPQTGRPTMVPLPDDQVKAKRKQMDDILKRLRAGEDFAKLATQYSEDPGTKDTGGELPPFARAKDSQDSRQAMVLEFETAAFSLTNNQISDVITTQYGYHIIQLLDRTPAVKLAFTDKLPSSTVTVAEYIKNNILDQQKLSDLLPDYIKKLTKDAGVEILDPTLKPLMTDDAATAPATPAK